MTYTPGFDVAAMDKTVDPCVDFYACACGGWQKKNPIPADQSSWSLTAKLQEQDRELLRLILKNAATPDSHSPPKHRTNGVVINMPEFQEAFKCNTGQPMAPAERCRVW